MIKKILTLILILACVPAYAGQKKLQIKYVQKKNKDLVAHRSPLVLPIDIYFEVESLSVEVVGPAELEAEVYVYDAFDTLEDYSPCLNTVLSVTESPYHTIVIENDSWTGTAVIE